MAYDSEFVEISERNIMCTIEKVNAVMNYYRLIRRRKGYEWTKFADYRHLFNIINANKFLIGVMLDQLGNADRAWIGAEHLVDNYFNETDGFWQEIIDTHHTKLQHI